MSRVAVLCLVLSLCARLRAQTATSALTAGQISAIDRFVNHALMPAKLAAIPDVRPALAENLKKLLAQIAAGKDVCSQLSAEMAAALSPEETKDLRSELKDVWPSDPIVLVIRKQIDGGAASCYRVRTGDRAMLITYGLDKDGRVWLFADAPDQEYQ